MLSATPRHVTALEYDALPVSDDADGLAVTTEEAEELVRIGEKRRGFCERTHRAVHLAQYCGVVNLGTRTLEVLPKVGVGRDPASARSVLLRLLRVAGLYHGFRSAPAGQRLERGPLLEIFIALFLETVTGILRGGLLRQYMHRNEDLRVVRGQIDLTRQFGAHFNRVDLVACRYDYHTADNPWNRMLKAGLRLCRPWIVRGDLQRRWVELMAAFDDVADITVLISDIDRLTYDRQVIRYRDAIVWVRWIVALLAPSLRAGGEHAPALLFDMNAVFERATEHSLRRRLSSESPEAEIAGQDRHFHLARRTEAPGRPAYGLMPDIVVREKGIVRLVADAKWKRVDVNSAGRPLPSRADMYQMNAYAAVYPTERLTLIYPVHGGVTAESKYRLPEINGRHPVVSVMCIDVERDDLPITIGQDSLSFTPDVPAT